MEEIEKMMAQALAANEVAAQNMVAGARAEREKAAQERAAAQEALSETERNAQALFEGFVEKHRVRIARDLHFEAAKRMAERLLRAGEPVSEAAALLDLSDGMIKELAEQFGYVRKPFQGSTGEEADAQYMRVRFTSEAKGGHVIFQWGNTTCQFWYEFGTGKTLVFIDIPAEAHWEAQTGLPLRLRMDVLRFIAEQAVEQKAPGYLYRIEEKEIVVYK